MISTAIEIEKLELRAPDRKLWHVSYEKGFSGDILFFSVFEKIESYSICRYILKVVKEEHKRDPKERRKELVLSGRDVHGRHALLHIPYEILETAVANGYVRPKVIEWFTDLDQELMMAFIPLATVGKDRFPKKLFEGLLESVRRTRKNKKDSATSKAKVGVPT